MGEVSSGEVFFFWLVLVVFSMLWTYYLALKMNRDPVIWLILCLFITGLAPLFLLILPNQSLVKCPACAEEVNREEKYVKSVEQSLSPR